MKGLETEDKIRVNQKRETKEKQVKYRTPRAKLV